MADNSQRNNRSLIKPVSPCYGCKDRVADPTCHGYCEKYIAFDKECERIRQEKYEIAEKNRVQDDLIKRRIRLSKNGGIFRKPKGE